MIAELMYGITPSAKMVAFSRLPPVNMLYRPNMELLDCCAIRSMAARFTPGIVMCAPTRYTPSSASVNRIRLRRSAIANRFFSGLSIVLHHWRKKLERLGCAANDLRRAARGRNLLGRLAAELVRAHRQLLRHIAASQHLYRHTRPRDHPRLDQQLRRHHRPVVETLGQRVQVHHRVLDAELVVEATIRDAAMQRHLAAFEAALERVARARLGALVPAPGLRALSGTVPAPNTLLRVLGAIGWLEIAQIHYDYSGGLCVPP